MDEGFISLHRKLWENPISQKPNYIAVWVYVLSHANFKDKHAIINGKKTLIKRGSYFGSIAKIADHFKLSRSVVKSIIDYFEKDKMLYTVRTRSHTVFTVVNYDSYQGVVHRKNTARTPPATTNNDNKDNNDRSKKEGVLISVPDFISGEVWENWIKHRSEIKKKLTPTQSTAQIKKLTAWHSEGLDVNQIIQNSTSNGWTGLFKPKANTKTKGLTPDEELQQYLDRPRQQ